MNTFAGEISGSKKRIPAGDRPATFAGQAAEQPGGESNLVDSDIPGFKNPVNPETGEPDLKTYIDAETLEAHTKKDAMKIAQERDPAEAMYPSSKRGE